VAIANLVVRISADIADFEKSFAGLGRTLQRQGRDLENIGSRLTQGLTLPLAGLAAVAAKAAISFESSFAGVRKTVDATEGQFKELEQGFRNLAKTMPLSVNEINRVAEAAGQLGIGRTEILAFTQTMVKLGATTNLSAEEAATGMAQFANALGQPKINAEQLASALVALGNNGASTEKQPVPAPRSNSRPAVSSACRMPWHQWALMRKRAARQSRAYSTISTLR
jgi:hypothetical protein